jgi:hypothetical protein
MLKIIDSVVLLCILISIIFIDDKLVYALGGTISLIILLLIFYYISYVLKIFQLNVTLLSILLLLLIGINYLNYYDFYELYTQKTIIVFYCVLIVLILICLCFALITPLSYSHHADQYIKIRQNFKLIVFNNTMFPFVYVLFICIIFSSFQEAFPLGKKIIKLIPTSLVCIPIFLLLLQFILNKRIKDDHLDLIFKKAKKIDPSKKLNLKSIYTVLMCVLFVLGSIIELIRNEWILWIGTFVTINISVILLWNMYQHRPMHDQDIPLVKVDNVESLNTPKPLIITWITNAIGLLLVVVSVMGLIYFFNIRG